MPFVSEAEYFVMNAALDGYECPACKCKMDYAQPTPHSLEGSWWVCPKCKKEITAEELIAEKKEEFAC